jgi:hypothetical protein
MIGMSLLHNLMPRNIKEQHPAPCTLTDTDPRPLASITCWYENRRVDPRMDDLVDLFR